MKYGTPVSTGSLFKNKAMADLSSYVNISVVLDKSTTPVIRITDTSTYPNGVPAGITGILSIKQPDGVTVAGNFGSPDIFYSSGSLVVSEKELRLATDSNFQKGAYVITYTVHHASYTETVLIKNFSIDYTRANLVITEAFDVFTPSLKVNDSTSYATTGFGLQSHARSWAGAITSIGSVTGGDVSQFDLLYSTHYYDAEYAVTLTSIPVYTVTAYPYVSVIDKMSVTATYTTEKPKTLNVLFSSITAYKNNLGNECTEEKKLNYQYAFDLFQHFRQRGVAGDKSALIDMYQELEAVLNDGVAPGYALTNTIIPAYDFSAFNGDPSGGAASSLVITSQPASLTKSLGQAATFGVTAIGPAVLTYQWYKNGVSISGATSSSYSIAVVAAPDEAVYTCLVTDGFANTVLSNAAALSIAAAGSGSSLDEGFFDS